MPATAIPFRVRTGPTAPRRSVRTAITEPDPTNARQQPVVTVTVGLIEGNSLMREGLRSLFEHTEGYRCVGAWSDPSEALRTITLDPPDVLIIDSKLPGQACYDLLRALPVLSANTRILVTVECSEERCVVVNPRSFGTNERPLRLVSAEFAQADDCLQLALKMGAHGVMRKQRPFTEMLQVIQTIHSGERWMEATTATRLADQYLVSLHAGRTAVTREEPGIDALTLRERQVVTLIAKGRSNKEIARELQMAYSTVKNYVSSILEKLKLDGRTQIALYALEQTAPDA